MYRERGDSQAGPARARLQHGSWKNTPGDFFFLSEQHNDAERRARRSLSSRSAYNRTSEEITSDAGVRIASLNK